VIPVLPKDSDLDPVFKKNSGYATPDRSSFLLRRSPHLWTNFGQPSSFCSAMALDIGYHLEHHVYHLGIGHRLSVEAGFLLGIGTVCAKDQAGVLEQDSASRLSMTCNV
jgi:hypothetical protein